VTKASDKDAEFYRACAAEMMAKAQAAPTKGIRHAYLNLALKWARKASDPAQRDANSPAAGPPSKGN
jgi:hypothetical protein